MTMLNIVNKSPFERNGLSSCLRLAQKGAAVLLIEDGVYAALENTEKSDLIKNRLTDLNFYVLSSDLDIRGLSDSKIINGVLKIDYGDFVDLVEKYDAAHSWL